MSVYEGPIRTAIFIFPFLAFAISFIFIIYDYRRYGVFLLRRAIILYSFVFYLLCAYFLVILPLPPRAEVAHYTSQILELRPFYSVIRFLNETKLELGNPSTYLPALKQGVVLEPFFNILLLVPFGVYLRYYFKLPFKKVVLSGFLLSLFFELTQLSGLYFIYPRPYRLADVNDLMNNTLGAVIGYGIAPALTFFLPTRDSMDEEAYQKGQRVTLFRRLTAFLTDWFLMWLVEFTLIVALSFIPQFQKWDEQTHFSDSSLLNWLMIFFVFMVLPTLMNGQTIGKKFVKIRIVEEGRRKIRFRALFLRYGSLYFLFDLSTILLRTAGDWLNATNHWLWIFSLIFYLISLSFYLLFIFNIGYSILRRKRMFYERVSHTYTVSTIREQENFEKTRETS